MEKPFSLRVEDMANNIINEINSAGLPLVVVGYVLRSISANVEAGARQQLDAEMVEWHKHITDQDKKGDE